MKLYEYQENYFLNVKKNWIYDMDTGTGKTFMGLNHYLKLFPECKLLIIAPASKVKEGGWQRTIKELNLNIEYEIFSYNMLSKIAKNYGKETFIIFDEGHRLKNSTGVWGKAGYLLSQTTKGFIILSATPIPNGWEDAINYFKMFKIVKNKTEFLREYCKTDAIFGYNRITGYKNEHILGAYWNEISRRLNKSEALDLPALVQTEVFFKRSTRYKTTWKERIWEGVVFENNMDYRHALRVSTSLEEKIKYLSSFLEDTNNNVIIFYNYDEELVEMKKAFVGLGKTIYECNGKVKNFPLKDEWENIKNTITLANYKSGSEAVEFTYGNVIIYFTPTESYTEFVQSIGRCYRNGQNAKVTVYKYITTNTIEEQIYSALSKKQDFNFKLWIEQENRRK